MEHEVGAEGAGDRGRGGGLGGDYVGGARPAIRCRERAPSTELCVPELEAHTVERSAHAGDDVRESAASSDRDELDVAELRDRDRARAKVDRDLDPRPIIGVER